MAAIPQSHAARGQGVGAARAPIPALKTVRPKLFRRASLTSWGKDNLNMTRAAAEVNLTELMLTVQQQKYEDRDKAAQREMSRTASYEGEESIRQRNKRRDIWLSRSSEKKNFITTWEREGRSKWNANQAALCQYERRLLNYELAVKATAETRQRLSRAQHANDETDGIRWFEKNLDKLGLDPGGNTGGSGAGADSGTLAPDKESRATFRSRLVRAVLDQKFKPGSNAEAMNELRFRGNAGRRARHEREHRRIKTEVDQRRAKTETDAQRTEDERLESTLAEGRERRAIAAAYWERKHALESKAQSDKQRFAEMTEAEKIAFDITFDARAAATRERFASESAERETRADALRASLREKRAGKRRHAETMCAEIARKIVDLTVVASEARAYQGGVPLPPTEWARLKRWFCSSEPIFPDTTPPKTPSEPRNPVLETKACLQRRNLDRGEGNWRPPKRFASLATEAPPQQSSPLTEALSIARDLAEATGDGPRESPTYGCRGGGDKGLSAKLVLLGCRYGLDALCAELGGWTSMYVCKLDTALECAMEVGAEMATAADTKTGKGRKSATVAGGKGSVASGAVDDSGLDEAEVAEAAKKAKDAIARRAFDPDASENDTATFKEAALAYYTLRTNPKKAAAPVPLATTTDLLVKHLACRAPRDQGWILVGYPGSLIESKMLENALTGYMDGDVTAELGGGGKTGKSDPRKKKGSTVPQEEIPQPTPKSGLDAVLNLTELISDQGRRQQREREGVHGQPDGNSGQDFNAPNVQEKAEVVDEGGEAKKDEDDSDRVRLTAEESDARMAWWASFEGGQLACDVPNEANDGLLLETLFLLANIAQNRKDESNTWLEEQELLTHKAPQMLLEGGDTDSGLEVAPSATSADDPTPPSVERSSPLARPLTASLADMRRQRRDNMSHATRIYVEALLGERELDLAGVRSAVALAERGRRESEGDAYDDASNALLQLLESGVLRRLETECSASSVVDWTAAAEFSFAQGLRTPDGRWTTACLKLEDEIAGWLARREEAAAAASRQSSRGRGRGRGTTKDESGGRREDAISSLAAAPPADEDPVWEALEAFELEAGDIVDHRHASAEATVQDIDSEAEQRMLAWTGSVAVAATDLCAAERDGHNETVESLRVLNDLFGLNESCSSERLDLLKASAQEAVDALAKDLSAVASAGRGFGEKSGKSLAEEVHRAIQEMSPPCDRMSASAQETRKVVTPSERGVAFHPVDDSKYHNEVKLETGRQVSDEPSTLTADGVVVDLASGLTTGAGVGSSLSRETDTAGSNDKVNETEGALVVAVWRCRQIYACRLRRIVARLERAIARCTAIASSTRGRLRHLKRRRVQLEHESITTSTLIVRRALAECDLEAIEDIIQNGIPLWVEDGETVAADPYVALPWGASCLGLSRIVSLTVALRDGLRSEAGGVARAIPAVELARLVRTWTGSLSTEGHGEVVGEEIPPTWISGSNGYLEALCRGIGLGVGNDDVSWRRLVHCLLLGHIRSPPTLEDLRSMRNAFQLKASSSARPSTGALGPKPSPTATMGLGGEEIAAGCAVAEQATSLRIAQRHLPGIRMWFEEGGEMEVDALAAGEEEGGARGASSSTIKAVYSEAWGEDDGRFDGLDFLFTLCAAPRDNASTPGAEEASEDDDGIPFSLGLFRAFAMLDDTTTRSSTTDHVALASNRPTIPATIIKATSSDTPSLSQANLVVVDQTEQATPDKRGSTDGKQSSHDDGEEEQRGRCIPRVTLPHLRAILEHGGGMPADDVLDVCGSVSKAEESRREHRRKRQDRRQLVRQSVPNEPEGAIAGRGLVGGDADGNTTRDSNARNSSSEGADGNVREEGEEGQVVGGEVQVVGLPSTTAGSQGAAPGGLEKSTEGAANAVGIFQDGPQEDTRQLEVDSNAGGDVRVAARSNAAREEQPLTVSFVDVCDCAAVRTWVRRGAFFTLPPFGVTSGRDIVCASDES